MLANEKGKGMGDQEEGMDLADEVDMGGKVTIMFLRSCGIGHVLLMPVSVHRVSAYLQESRRMRGFWG